eukprot:sb/3470650/
MSHSFLSGYRVILASGSPRRKELMAKIGIPAEVIPSKFEENLSKSGVTAGEYTISTARGKAREVWGEHRDGVIVGADTVVVSADGAILEKPRDKDHAFEMLKGLSDGRTHTVVTGVCLLYGERERTFYTETEVLLRRVSDEMIRWYVTTGEPMDKAGGYGIQSLGAVLVEKVNGCYSNVVGLPVSQLLVELQELLTEKTE